MVPDERQLYSSPAPVRITATGLIPLLQISPDALLVINQAGTIMTVNEQAEALFGFTHAELPGQQLEILLPERFRDAHITHRKNFFSAPLTRQMGAGLQLPGKRKDGTEFPVDISLKPLLIDDTLHVIAAVRDKTEHKRTEEELAKRLEDSQQLNTLNTILSATDEYVYLYDSQGRYRFASESAAKALGFQQSDFLGKTWQELGLPPEFMQSFEEQRQRVMLTGQNIVDEISFPIGEEMRWLEYTAKPIVNQERKVTFIVVSTKDITERRQAQDAQHRLAAIVESSGDAILSKTLEGVITSWNKGAEKLFGYRAGEAIGQSISLIIPPDHQQELPEILAQIAQGKTLEAHETTRVGKDGTRIQVSVTISPILDDNGYIIGASTITHDNTEHKRIMQDLIDVNAALVAANLARGQFLATMSHELRTPLASIIGFSEMLLEDFAQAGIDPALKDDQERILKNAKHLLDLINDVLDLSKIEAGRMDITVQPVNVRSLLTSVVDEIRSIALAQHLSLRVEVEEGLDVLETNELKLHQILLNLVSNALKFTKQGEVTLSARRVEAPDKEGERVELAVTDTGMGIRADLQERIFEAFYQADGSYTRKYGGTGLGLAIVRQLTTLLGGTVQLKSAPGQGSTFTVLLPNQAVHQPVERPFLRLHPILFPASLAANREANDEQNNVVLAVDDNPDVIEFIKAAFKNTLYKVVGVTDPSKVMESIQELRPCAITLDVMMPTLNGWQILHLLKDNPASASIPVIMLSVLTEPSTGYVLGADDYLTKPFKREALVSTLNRLVVSRRSTF